MTGALIISSSLATGKLDNRNYTSGACKVTDHRKVQRAEGCRIIVIMGRDRKETT